MRVVQTQIVAALILTAMTLLSNVIKHKLDKYFDDNDKITWLSILKACSNDVLATLLTTVIPIGASEITSIFKAFIKGKQGQRGFDFIQFPLATAINDFISDLINLRALSTKVVNGTATAEQFEKTTMNFLGDVGGLFQIPVNNLYLIFKGIIEWVKEFADN